MLHALRSARLAILAAAVIILLAASEAASVGAAPAFDTPDSEGGTEPIVFGSSAPFFLQKSMVA